VKTISLSDPSAELKALLEQAREESLILQTPDGTEFILAEIDDFEKEVELTRQNEELMAYLEERARQPGRTSHVEVKKMLGLE
jgi:hypothetical protein